MTRALRFASQYVRTVAHRTGNAARVIGHLREGDHVTGVTAGQFSSIDAVDHMVSQLGPCHVWVSTWTTGIYDVQRGRQMQDNASILSWRFLLDKGTFEKSPKFAGPLIEALGVEAFRCMAVHAKVTILVDKDHKPVAAMRSSMNLNKNLRTEQFDISVGGEVAAFYADWFELLWDEAGVGGTSAEVMKAVFDRFEGDGTQGGDDGEGLDDLHLGRLADE